MYSNQDQGWFENEYDERAFGAQDMLMLRPVVSWRPSDTLDLTLRYEYQDLDGDGPAAQNHTGASGMSNPFASYDRDSHDFAVDEEGYNKTEVHFFNARADWDVPFGDGTITNIFGWRDAEIDLLSDIDATPQPLFNGGALATAEQFSNELRYAGRFFDKLLLTSGFYYFTNEIDYHEYRILNFGRIQQNGGGLYDVETFGLFMSGDYDLTDHLTLTAGLRYTHENKEAEISNLTLNTGRVCKIVRGPGPDCPSHFEGDESWNNLSPKIGLTYRFNDDTLVYAHWTRGFRSGGYNLRDTYVSVPNAQRVALGLSPDPPNLGADVFDEEQIDNFEIGFKKTFGTRARLNAAFFYNFIDDLQRELNFPQELPDRGCVARVTPALVSRDPAAIGGAIQAGDLVLDPIAGRPVLSQKCRQANLVQVVRNTADAEMYGVEVEGSFALTPAACCCTARLGMSSQNTPRSSSILTLTAS